MLASTCFVASATGRMFQQMGLILTKPYLLKKALMRHRTRTKMLRKSSRCWSSGWVRLQQLRLRIIRLRIVRLRQEQQPMMLVTSYLHLLFLERGRNESGGWRFYSSAGVMQKGLFTIDDKVLSRTRSGIMKTGWQQVLIITTTSGSKDGSMRTGWLSAGSTWVLSAFRWFDEVKRRLKRCSTIRASNDGAMKTGWHRFQMHTTISDQRCSR